MKSSFSSTLLSISACLLGTLGFACGGTSGAGTLTSCETANDCAGNEVCVGLDGAATCHIQCSANANECGGSASCQGIGGVSLDVCKEKKDEPSGSGGGDSTAEQPQEDWLRCTADADCAAYDPSAVCGKWRGFSYCTVACQGDNDCNPPSVGGVTTNFIACTADEGNAARTICVPRESCFDDPTSCIQIAPGVEDPNGTGGTGSGGSRPDSGGSTGTGGGDFGTGGGDFGTGGGDFSF